MNENDSSNSIDTALSELLAAVNEVNSHIDTSNLHSRETLEHVDARVETTTADLNNICADLDAAQIETEEALDTLILTEIDAIVESKE
jgi:hypothetical protein